ncbi:hypothetical protein CRG98_029742, partial [Punica granatum]
MVAPHIDVGRMAKDVAGGWWSTTIPNTSWTPSISLIITSCHRHQGTNRPNNGRTRERRRRNKPSAYKPIHKPYLSPYISLLLLLLLSRALSRPADSPMEYRSSTLSKKLGGSSLNGTSIYDGVFSGSAPFRPSSFSSSSSSASRPEDYAEIFGGPRDSRRSSIPVLDVPALHDRKVSVDVRSSKLEYSNIFGGGSNDGSVSFEDVVVDPRKMRNLSRREQTRAHTRSSSEVSFSGSEDNHVLRKASHASPDKVKKQVNVSYNKSVGGGKDGLNGMTHIAELHDVPGYARLVDENNPSKQLKNDKPITNGAHHEFGTGDRVVKAKDAKRSKSSLSSSSSDKKYSKDVSQDRSPSHSSLFEGYEFGLRTEPSEVHAPSDLPQNGNSRLIVSPSKVSKGGVGTGSPTYFDEEVDANSVAAASADAVRKAIEKAQARIKVAKDLMERRKEAFQGNVESKSSREPRRERKKASKPQEQRLEEYAKVGSVKTECESTDISDHARHSNNIARRTFEQLSRDTREYNLQGEAVERDESNETKTKTLEEKQELTDDCEMLMMGRTTESAAGISTLSTAVEGVPLQKVHEKTEGRPSSAEVAHECDNHSDKSESSRQLQYVEEQSESAEEPMASSDQRECHGYLEEFHESSSQMKLDAYQLEEKTARAEDCVREENEEKQSEGHEVEGSIRSKANPDNEENTTHEKFDEREEKEEREGESYEGECGWEQNEEKRSKNHEGSLQPNNISDGEEKNTSCEKIEGKEENREIQGESCEKEGGEKSEEASNQQESKNEYNGFSLGTDAKQWFDHMKEILHVRINSFLDGKENSRLQEGGEVEGNHQLEAEVSEELVEETCGVEAIEELHSAEESVIDEKPTIEVNMRGDDEAQDAATEDKEDECEELMGTMEVSYEENRESVDITRDYDEYEGNEVMAQETNLSVEEKEILVVNSIILNKDEPTNLSVGQEDNSPIKLEEEEICGSEKSDLTGGSLQADGEKQVEDAMEVLGFYESDVKLAFTGIKFGFCLSNQYTEKPEEVHDTGKRVEGLDPQIDECDVYQKAAEVSSNEGEETEEMTDEMEVETKVSDDDDRWADNEKAAEVSSNEEEEAEMTNEMEVKTEASDDDRWADNEVNVEKNQLHVVPEREERTVNDNKEMTTSQATEEEESRLTTQMTKEKETEDHSKTGLEMERDTSRKRDDRKEREREKEIEREREKERLAVERAIREARERAFAEARERAERAAVEKAAAEARQRVMARAREKLGKTSSDPLNKPAEKTSVEVRLRAERAAVERATAEARERALEKAMSEKLSGAGKDNKARQKSSYDSQHKSSGPSSNHRNSSSSDNGVPRSTERSNGSNTESAQWSKARLERHKRTAERA